jgi:hypothetical protein
MTEPDPFDDLLSLEERFYDEGFQLGSKDGAKAGRIEGRVFGLEKGFEKYIESGRLHGRSVVWAGRMPQLQSSVASAKEAVARTESHSPTSTSNNQGSSSCTLPTLPGNPRLEKHLKVLYALTEPVSLSTDNTEEAVSDFDDRLKRAVGKIKIIERLVGEEGSTFSGGPGSSSQQNAIGLADASIEDVDILKARH